MAGEVQDNIWPMPKFHFGVSTGDFEFLCQEVSGLEMEADISNYRAGASNQFSVVKMPGKVKRPNVGCRKLVLDRESGFWDWYRQVGLNTIQRKDLRIELLDENAAPQMVWTLANAWPTKVAGTDLKSDGTDMAVEEIEFAHDGITISTS